MLENDQRKLAHTIEVMMTKYPKREKFFSHRFTRLLAKCCVANEIGAIGAWMLTVIVQTEDASHYRRGVTFYDGQLMPLLGLRSKCTMTAIRKRAVESGWLHFEPGHKGKASTYWVKIPDHAKDIDDNPTDEGFNEDEIIRYKNCTESRSQLDRNEIANRSQTGHYYPNPIPTPIGDSGEVKITIQDIQESSEAAQLAQEFHFRIPGTSKPILSDLVAEFQAKLDWLKATGRNETEHIRKCIVDPKRDKSAAKTIGTMFKFWQFCGLEEKKHERRDNHRRGSPMSAGGGRYEGIKPRIVKL